MWVEVLEGMGIGVGGGRQEMGVIRYGFWVQVKNGEHG